MSTLTVLVLLFGYHTSASSRAAAQDGNTSATSPVTGNSPTTSGDTDNSGTTSSSSSAAATTLTGDVASTRWGPVQVELTVASGTITDVSVVQYPDGNGKDQQINARALPILIQETLDA